MRTLGFALSALLAVSTAGGAFCQTAQFSQGEPVMNLPFVALDEGRLFAETLYGQALVADYEAARQALATENRELEAALAEREQDLTEQRRILPVEDFRKAADLFNTDVQHHRRAQIGKEQLLARDHEEDRERFRLASNQLLADIMRERGALAVLDAKAILLGFSNMDITDLVIARMDEVIGAGEGVSFEELPPQTP